MASVADFLISIVIVVIVLFVLVAGLSLLSSGRPQTPAFARRAPTSGSSQFRQDSNASFFFDRGFLFRRRCWFTATCCPPIRYSVAHWSQLSAEQVRQPVQIARSVGRVWWWFENAFYWESCNYSSRDVMALVRDRQRKQGQRLDRAHMLLNVEEGRTEPDAKRRREPIPREARRAVFERDGGQCVQCGSRFDLQYDHVIPLALGGANAVDNLQLLCGQCNRQKGADL
ncbi:MAG TPA: HNH endonuclease signature motif containing protein [Streptosporangiaceae bacterium]|nr:HNH endonuclease signature motif containing protein [Streptosporangiaceae bacterium]